MNKKSTTPIWLAIGLILLTISCQTLSNIEIISSQAPTSTPRSWPHSTFIPPQKSVQISVGQALQIDSYHASANKLKTIQIFINGQELTTEATTAAGRTDTFPRELARVQVRSEDGQVQVSEVEPDVPTTSKTISLIWMGHVPGIYELSMIATDAAGRPGNTIVQRIEVK